MNNNILGNLKIKDLIGLINKKSQDKTFSLKSYNLFINFPKKSIFDFNYDEFTNITNNLNIFIDKYKYNYFSDNFSYFNINEIKLTNYPLFEIGIDSDILKIEKYLDFYYENTRQIDNKILFINDSYEKFISIVNENISVFKSNNLSLIFIDKSSKDLSVFIKDNKKLLDEISNKLIIEKNLLLLKDELLLINDEFYKIFGDSGIIYDLNISVENYNINKDLYSLKNNILNCYREMLELEKILEKYNFSNLEKIINSTNIQLFFKSLVGINVSEIKKDKDKIKSIFALLSGNYDIDNIFTDTKNKFLDIKNLIKKDNDLISIILLKLDNINNSISIFNNNILLPIDCKINSLDNFLNYFNKIIEYIDFNSKIINGLNISYDQLLEEYNIIVAEQYFISEKRDLIEQEYNRLNDEVKFILLEKFSTQVDIVEYLSKILDKYDENKDKLKFYFDYVMFYSSLDSNVVNIIDYYYSVGEKIDNIEKIFSIGYLYNIIISNLPSNFKNNINSNLNSFFDELNELNNNIIDKIKGSYQNNANSIINYNKVGIKSLFNKKGSKGVRRNSLRKIIEYDIDTFKNFFPVILTTPESVGALFPLQRDLFDLVIFDESSQLRLEDTITSLIRGKEVIICGDSKQMPPSNYFVSGIEEDLGDEEEYFDIEKNIENNLMEQESLLSFGDDIGFKNTLLSFHYRSEHPDLIEFSNQAFYNGKLLSLPSREEYNPIEYIDLKGIYDSKTNTNDKEVNYIINKLIEIGKENPGKSVLVATFNIQQRNLIKDKLSEIQESDTSNSNIINQLETDGLVIRNLENIQGDEKDILIISTTFGVQENGSFRQSFGKINTQEGYRYLNVLVTRAKHKKYIVTSIPNEYIGIYKEEILTKGNIGKGIFYAYLAYCKSVSESDVSTKNNILLLLNHIDINKAQVEFNKNFDGFDTESPFEEEVLDVLFNYIDKENIETQFQCAGFRLDIVIKGDGFNVVVECDGASYHSSEMQFWNDKYRQNILEGYGFNFIRIWSTDWWENNKAEILKLEQQLLEYGLIDKTKITIKTEKTQKLEDINSLKQELNPENFTDKECPYCNSTLVRSKGYRGDKKRLYCKDCLKSWSVILDDIINNKDIS